MKYQIISEYYCNSIITDAAKTIDLSEEQLNTIGKSHKFDVDNLKIIPMTQVEIDDAKNIRDSNEAIAELASMRLQRDQECFSVINRGKLWYDSLNPKQLAELQEWYQAWLNVTETMVIPEKPEWVK